MSFAWSNLKSASDKEADAVVTALIYELLDAHADTSDLARELAWDMRWQAHLEYLQSLQRVGREALAQIRLEATG